MSSLIEKQAKLKQHLATLGRVLVAFSGGVDSAFLVYIAWQVLGRENVLAVIGVSPTYSSEEEAAARRFCQDFDIVYQVITTNEFDNARFIANPANRCYYCKQELFTALRSIAREKNFPYIIDGSNFDDQADYRPGSQAKKEAGVISPLLEAGFTKEEIRMASRELNLPTWSKPACACLASRIPYGTSITPEILLKIDEGEKFLRSHGFKQVRVRHHGAVARIEVEQEKIPELFDDDLRNAIHAYFQKLGYMYVTIDLGGYRVGSMNEVLQ